MNWIPCRYHDGRASRSHEAALRIGHGGEIVIVLEDSGERIACRDVRIPGRVADTPRHLHLPGGAMCEVRDNDALDAERARAGRGEETLADRFRRLRHQADSTWRGAAATLAITAAILYAFTEWGARAVATVAVAATPAEVETVIGENVLELLRDLDILEPSELDQARRDELLWTFEEMRERTGVESAELHFHSVGMPNAFALPGGAVVLTDALVELAENDEEIAAVMAHELGHVSGRHVMRRLAQTSSMLVLWTAFTGDVSVAAISLLVPERLLAMRYSRAFERDADQFAFDYLIAAGIPPTRLGDILQRLEAASGADGMPNWLASHPGSAERAMHAEEAARRAREDAVEE